MENLNKTRILTTDQVTDMITVYTSQYITQDIDKNKTTTSENNVTLASRTTNIVSEAIETTESFVSKLSEFTGNLNMDKRLAIVAEINLIKKFIFDS